MSDSVATACKVVEMDRRIATDVFDAREAESRHVARALPHEERGQRLSAIKMELGSLCQGVDPDARERRLNAVLGSLDQAPASLRRIAIDLRGASTLDQSRNLPDDI